MIVVALLSTLEAQGRIRSALPPATRVHFCRFEHELLPLVSGRAADVVVVETRDAANELTAAAVQSVHGCFPHLAITVYCALDPQSMRDLVEITRAGASEAILRGYDDPRVWFQRCTRRLHSQRGTGVILGHLFPYLPPSTAPLVAYWLQSAHENPTVASAARALGVHRKTLVNRLAASFPPPRVLLSWCRLLVALEHLEVPTRSVESVALAMNFGSAAALRKLCLRYTSMPLSQLRARGGVDRALAVLTVRLDQSKQDLQDRVA